MVFLYCPVLLASFSYLRLFFQWFSQTRCSSHQNTLQSQQDARSLWQYALAYRVVPLAILSCSVWETWSIALPLAREVLMWFAVLELVLCTAVFLGYYLDTEAQLSSEPFPPPKIVRASAIDKLFATSRMFTFEPEDVKDADVLEVDEDELHQDMCTICLADFEVGDSATRFRAGTSSIPLALSAGLDLCKDLSSVALCDVKLVK
eukprot:CAMPEP_0115061222 /NCGR_PEP_ID=MMETSP0227-20121206/7889_1 /TAXON_ID=89957 /ORGANISM="Polarella glacialis, Strain CCMP 1383" /LENGTH=204 /DNA_ID=CAMNT_0002446503 /DNA_START=219 /DNA_END=834 /DNA_ORIENTATION=+